MTEHELCRELCRMYEVEKYEFDRAVAYFFEGNSRILHRWTGYDNRIFCGNDFPELREYLRIIGNKPEYKYIKDDLAKILK